MKLFIFVIAKFCTLTKKKNKFDYGYPLGNHGHRTPKIIPDVYQEYCHINLAVLGELVQDLPCAIVRSFINLQLLSFQ